MTAAPFIALWCGSSARAGAVHGAFVQEPHTAALRAEIGMASALPTVLVGGSAGLLPNVDLGAHAVTHAGLAHAFGATVRYRSENEHLGAGLTVDESLYTVEELAGIQSLRSPFGSRFALTPQLLAATGSPDGVQFGWTVGAEVGLIRTDEDDAGYAVREVAPNLDHLWGEVAASWPREHGAFYVRVRALIPIASEFHLLGYVPWIAVGRSWGVH